MDSKYGVGDSVIPIHYPHKKLPCTVSQIYEHKIFSEGEYSYSVFLYRLKEWSYEYWFSARELASYE